MDTLFNILCQEIDCPSNPVRLQDKFYVRITTYTTPVVTESLAKYIESTLKRYILLSGEPTRRFSFRMDAPRYWGCYYLVFQKTTSEQVMVSFGSNKSKEHLINASRYQSFQEFLVERGLSDNNI